MVVLSVSAVSAVATTVMRFWDFEALLKIIKEIRGCIMRFLDGSDSWAHNLLIL
jgi:hypothetical protein